MRNRYWWGLVVSAVLTLFLAACSDGGGGGGSGEQETWTYEEDFEDTTLIPPLTPFPTWIREVRSGKLVIETQGNSYPDFNDLCLADANTITAFSAAVTVLHHQSTGYSVARLSGSFYNDGFYSGITGDLTSDILATLEMNDNIGVHWVIFRCPDNGCLVPDLLEAGGLADVKIGETHTLSISWDGGTIFTFDVDGLYSQSVDAGSLGMPNVAPANRAFRCIGTMNYLATTEQGYIAADFDEVIVNGLTYDNFDASTEIDVNKWLCGEFVQELVPGQFRLRSRGKVNATDKAYNTGYVHLGDNLSAVQVDVRLDQITTANADTGQVSAGLAAGYDTINGERFVYGIRLSGVNNNTSSIYYAGLCMPAMDCEMFTWDPSVTDSDNNAIVLSVELGRFYTLRLENDGSTITFKVEDFPPVLVTPQNAIAQGALWYTGLYHGAEGRFPEPLSGEELLSVRGAYDNLKIR